MTAELVNFTQSSKSSFSFENLKTLGPFLNTDWSVQTYGDQTF